MKILVIGSTGQLGFTIAKKLTQTDHDVVAFHRSSSDITALQQLPNVVLAQGNLLDPDTLGPALKGVDVVISTSNAALPSRKEDHFKNDVIGHKNLIEACKEAGIKQFIFTSGTDFGSMESRLPLPRSKRQIEDDLAASGIPYTVFKAAHFMDIHFAFMGSELPLNDVVVSSLRRPFKFMNNFYDGVRKNMAEKDTFGVVGKGDQPFSPICIDDVAEFHIKAVGNPKAMNRIITIGGPEELTPLDVKAIFEEAYGKELKLKSTPPFVLNLMSKIFSLSNINASNILAMQYASTKISAVVPNAREVAEEFGIQLTSPRAFIMEKAGMAETV